MHYLLPPQSFYILQEIADAHLDALHLAEAPSQLSLPHNAGKKKKKKIIRLQKKKHDIYIFRACYTTKNCFKLVKYKNIKPTQEKQ